jgi:hypothetical protein
VTSNSTVEPTLEEEKRRSSESDRRRISRSGRRKGDRRWPWWRQGAAFAAICVVLRCWRWFKRSDSL